MMNREMLHRIKIAGEYQKKAIHALFPERMSEHLNVIEKELKLMIMEIATDFMKECNRSDSYRDGQNYEQTSKAKKVDIV